PCRTPVDLFRPSTSLMLFGFQDVDARDKRGHDESITQGRWYEAPAKRSSERTSAQQRRLERDLGVEQLRYRTAGLGHAGELVEFRLVRPRDLRRQRKMHRGDGKSIRHL